jgi:hypothetical protein
VAKSNACNVHAGYTDAELGLLTNGADVPKEVGTGIRLYEFPPMAEDVKFGFSALVRRS